MKKSIELVLNGQCPVCCKTIFKFVSEDRFDLRQVAVCEIKEVELYGKNVAICTNHYSDI